MGVLLKEQLFVIIDVLFFLEGWRQNLACVVIDVGHVCLVLIVTFGCDRLMCVVREKRRFCLRIRSRHLRRLWLRIELLSAVHYYVSVVLQLTAVWLVLIIVLHLVYILRSIEWALVLKVISVIVLRWISLVVLLHTISFPYS